MQPSNEWYRTLFTGLFVEAQRRIPWPTAAEAVFTNRLQRAWFPMGDLLFLVDTAYDPAAATLTSSYTVIQGDRTERHQAVYHIYTYRQLIRMFEDAGFINIRGFGSLKQEP